MTASFNLFVSAWLTAYEHPVIERINQRIEDLTGLEMDTAEELQVSNRGTVQHFPYLPQFLQFVKTFLIKIDQILYFCPFLSALRWQIME